MFWSSESFCSFGFPNQIPCCTLQWNKVKFSRFSHSLGQMLRGFRKVQSVLGQMWKSHTRRCVSGCMFSLFRIELFLPFNTNFSCSLPRGVLAVLVFALHPDSLMMSGACLRSNSISKNRPVRSVSTLGSRFNIRRLFTSETSNPSVPRSIAVYLDLRSLSMCLGPSSSDKHAKSHHRALPPSHLHLDCGTMRHSVCLFGIAPALTR